MLHSIVPLKLSVSRLMVVALVTFVATNLRNYIDRPLPPAIRALGIDPACSPSWLYYPDYVRTLDMAAPLTPQLVPPKSKVRSAYRQTQRCFHPDKIQRHPGLDAAGLASISVVLKDARTKLLPKASLPRVVVDSPYYNTVRKTTPPLPHYAPNCASRCRFGTALDELLLALVRPYWMERAGPATLSELASYCPCDMGTTLAPWRTVLTWQWTPLPHVTFREDALPPRRVHDFWWSEELDQLAGQHVLAAWLRHWGRGGVGDSIGIRLGERFALEGSTKRTLVEQGWFSNEDFRGDVTFGQ